MPKPIIDSLLIAAGDSSRMGNFKPLLKLKNKTFITSVTEKLLSVCRNVVIVTGHNKEELEKEIRKSLLTGENENHLRIKCVYNPDYKDGMFTSIKTGIAEMTDPDWILFHFVDQPAIPQKFYNDLVEQVDENHDWIQPVYALKQGHPVLYRSKIIKRVNESPSNYRMKFIRDEVEVKKKYWICDYPEILEDIDTQEDYERFNNKDD